MTSTYRTVRWTPPIAGFFTQPPLRWPGKRPVDFEDFGLDLTLWLADESDTIASVTAGTLQPGIQVGTPTFTGGTVSVPLLAGIIGTVYSVSFVVTTVAGRVQEFPVSVACVAGLSTFPTSPVLLASGAVWYNAARNYFPTVPVWAALPTSQPGNLDGFWLNGGVVNISPASTFLPTSNAGLAIGDLWNNGGVVSCNGNPGLPTSSITSGDLVYSNNAISVVMKSLVFSAAQNSLELAIL